MILPKHWDIQGFFKLYLNKKFKNNQIVNIIEKYDSFNSFAGSHFEDNLTKLQAMTEDINQFDSVIERGNEILADCNRLGVRPVTYWDPEFPDLLRNITSPPILLFVLGNLPKIDSKLLSIIGTRNNTLYGKLTTEKFVEYFSNNSVEIVSGLAFGIDSIAHKKACDLKRKTYAVVASGVDKLSSAMTDKMAHKIIETGGGIISEYPCGTAAQRGYFPVRNRIISGMSKATLVIESGIKSGTLITARFAFEQNREVYAIPGNISSEKSMGCHYLIKNNQATLCTDPEQIMTDLGWKLFENHNQITEIKFDNDNEKKLYKILDHEPQQIDIIAERTDLDAPQVMVGLLNLEFKGLIKQLPGKNFIKV